MKNSKTFKVLLIFTFIAAMFINTKAIPAYAAKKMSISDKIVTLIVGKSQQISIVNKKKHKVTWKSNKEEVATVDDKGMITAKSVGVAKITGKVLGKKYTCTVKVSPAHLYSFEMFREYYYSWKENSDALGNIFSNAIGIAFDGHDNRFNNNPLEYYLRGKYNSIAGKAAFFKGNDKDAGDLCLVIYADEKEVYRTGPINERTEPIDFDVNIDNASFLKFSVEKLSGKPDKYRGRWLILVDPILE